MPSSQYESSTSDSEHGFYHRVHQSRQKPRRHRLLESKDSLLNAYDIDEHQLQDSNNKKEAERLARKKKKAAIEHHQRHRGHANQEYEAVSDSSNGSKGNPFVTSFEMSDSANKRSGNPYSIVGTSNENSKSERYENGYVVFKKKDKIPMGSFLPASTDGSDTSKASTPRQCHNGRKKKKTTAGYQRSPCHGHRSNLDSDASSKFAKHRNHAKNPFNTSFEVSHTANSHGERSSKQPYSIVENGYIEPEKTKRFQMGSYLPASTDGSSSSTTSVLSRKSSDSSVSTAAEFICCQHGQRCIKGYNELVNKKTADETDKEDDLYETADRFIKMKTVSAAEIASAAIDKERSRARRVGSCASSESTISDKDDEYGHLKGTVHASSKLRHRHDKEIDNSELDKLLQDDDHSSYYEFQNSENKKYEAVNARISKPKVEKMKIASPYDEALHRRYIGELSAIDAERRTLQKVSFFLYHRLPLRPPKSYDALPQGLPLYIVYRNSNGDCYHFPIIGKKNSHTGENQLSVDYGDVAPFFGTLRELVKYYETYTILGSQSPELFPWWNVDGSTASSKKKKASRH